MSKFKKLLRPRNLIIFFLVLSIIIVSFGTLVTRAGLNYQFGRLNHGQELAISSDYIATGNLGAARKKIINNSGVDYFVPTKTGPEWTAFLAATDRLGVTVISEFCGDGTCGTDKTNPAYPRAEVYSWCPSDCSAPYCGDAMCNNGETCSSCPGDCGGACAVCGDGTCNGTETTYNCTVDCGQPCYFTESCPGYPGDFFGHPVCTGAVYRCRLDIPAGSQDCLLYPGDPTAICFPDYCPTAIAQGVCEWVGTLPPAYY